MAIFETGKFQNHAGELTPTLHKCAFPKKSNPHGLQTNPKPSGALRTGQISLQPKNPENSLMK